MKKFLSLFLIAVMMLSFGTSAFAYSDDYTDDYGYSKGGWHGGGHGGHKDPEKEYQKLVPKVYINGERLYLQNAPFIENERTYVPLRVISENLGCEVSWDGKNNTVIIIQGQNTIKMPINSKTASVNNKSVTVDAQAKLVNGVTYVPIRFISEILGASVNYVQETKSIEIEY